MYPLTVLFNTEKNSYWFSSVHPVAAAAIELHEWPNIDGVLIFNFLGLNKLIQVRNPNP